MAAIIPGDSVLEVEQQLFEGKWREDDDGVIWLDGQRRHYHQRNYLEYQNLIKFVRLWNSTPYERKGKGSRRIAAWIVSENYETITLFFSWWSIIHTHLSKDISDFGPCERSGRQLLMNVRERLCRNFLERYPDGVRCYFCRKHQNETYSCPHCSVVWCVDDCSLRVIRKKCPNCKRRFTEN